MAHSAETLPQLLQEKALRWGDGRVAIREKEFGIWQAYTWRQYADHVQRIALGLASLGFRRGDKIAVIGDNRPQLYWTMVAAQALGGVPVPIYQDSIAAEMHYVIDHSESRVVVCEDQEQVDKILEMKDKLPAVQLVVYDDPKGMRHYDYPFLLGLDKVQGLGAGFAASHPGFWDAEVAKGKASDLAIINYTSGTTGFPKWTSATRSWPTCRWPGSATASSRWRWPFSAAARSIVLRTRRRSGMTSGRSVRP